jgi:hypothetical protein
MNKHQEHHHAMHHQDHSENNPQTDIGDPAAGKPEEHESALDELEKMMFKRAR